MAERKKQEKKKDGAQDKRVRPQGWFESRQTSRNIRRLAHVLRHNGEKATRSFAESRMLDGALNRMLRSPEYGRFRQARSRRAMTYPERRAQKRAAKRLAAEQAAAMAAQEAEQQPEQQPVTETVKANKPAKKPAANRRLRRVTGRVTGGAKPKATVRPRPRATAVKKCRIKPSPTRRS